MFRSLLIGKLGIPSLFDTFSLFAAFYSSLTSSYILFISSIFFCSYFLSVATSILFYTFLYDYFKPFFFSFSPAFCFNFFSLFFSSCFSNQIKIKTILNNSLFKMNNDFNYHIKARLMSSLRLVLQKLFRCNLSQKDSQRLSRICLMLF